MLVRMQVQPMQAQFFYGVFQFSQGRYSLVWIGPCQTDEPRSVLTAKTCYGLVRNAVTMCGLGVSCLDDHMLRIDSFVSLQIFRKLLIAQPVIAAGGLVTLSINAVVTLQV